MATFHTCNVYIPKDLLTPVAKYLANSDRQTLGRLLQEALREKLHREGFLTPENA